jgi:hypothetical protein
VPVDTALFDRLSTHWDRIKLALIASIHQQYRCARSMRLAEGFGGGIAPPASWSKRG